MTLGQATKGDGVTDNTLAFQKLSTVSNLIGEILAGWFVRLRSVTSGGGTTAFSSGQEITY